MKVLPVLVFVILLGLVAGCSKAKMVDAEAGNAARESIGGESPKPGALLAYAHDIQFSVAPDTMTRRVAAVQTACNEERFGTCSVLGIESNSGDYANASISVRVVPAGVEPLIGLAGEGDRVEKRSTKADDLADAVADVAAQQDLLQRQRETLLGFVARKDIAVADMIAVSQQLASIESMLQGLAQQSADQRRRIETNLLTIQLHSNAVAESDDGFSLRESWEIFSESLAEGVSDSAEYIGYFLPLVLVVFPLALLWRWTWRWATRKSREAAK
jgi:Domain of unknown function (DUF4349)